MMKFYKELLKERAEIRTKQSKINDCESIFDEYDKEPFSEEFWAAIDLVLKQLKEKEEVINEKMENNSKICTKNGKHIWESAGHDGHYSYEECTICGKMKKV